MLWLAVVAPLVEAPLSAAAAAPGSGAQGSFDWLRGLLYVVGVVGAIVCLGARPASGPPTIARILGSDAEWVIGPLIGGMCLLLAIGVDALGGPGDSLVLPVLIGSIVVAVVASRLPSFSANRRRLLMLPFLLGASTLFQSIMGTMDLGAFVRQMSGAGSTELFGLALLLAVGGSFVFYAMLIYAPRQVVEREGTPLGWAIRFGLFLASSLFGLGWLRLI
jgi:hypothetical protein